MGTSSNRAILHVDMDAFFASVEALESPELRGVPLIVGGDGARGVVASCSYEARFYGVRSAMPSVQAKRLCPHAVFVSGRYHLYDEYSRRMHEVFETFTPLVEGISLDEAFLDVTGSQAIFGSPEEIAWNVRNRLQQDLGLTASVGVATSKHVAKLASVRAKPKATKQGAVGGLGVMVIEKADSIAFLHSLPLRALWGLGPKSADRLARIGVTTVGELAKVSVDQLAVALGTASAEHLHALAWDRDTREVEPNRAAKSVGHEQTYAKDLHTDDEVQLQLLRLADAVSTRLRKSELAGRTVTCKVRFATFETVTRSRTLPKATASSALLLATARDVISQIDVGPGVRLLGLSVSNLEELVIAEQLSLGDDFGANDQAVDPLDGVIDRIRDRFGDSAVVPAPLVGPRGQGVLRRGDQHWGPGGSRERPAQTREED